MIRYLSAFSPGLSARKPRSACVVAYDMAASYCLTLNCTTPRYVVELFKCWRFKTYFASESRQGKVTLYIGASKALEGISQIQAVHGYCTGLVNNNMTTGRSCV